MAGRISFHFDDGHLSHYEQAFPVFQEAGVPGCMALIADNYRMSTQQALAMQEAGWEILSHSCNHLHMNDPMAEEMAIREIAESKKQLEKAGFRIRQFVTPMSQAHESLQPLLQEHYEAAFSVYTNSARLPIEELVIERPVRRHSLHRACLAGHTLEELKAYVDYVQAQDCWLVCYDHDLEVGKNITAPMLRALLQYCKEKQVAVVTSSEALQLEAGLE